MASIERIPTAQPIARDAPWDSPSLARSATIAQTPTGRYDSAVIFVCGALMALGVAMVYSASVSVNQGAFDWRHWWNTPLKQGVFSAAGFIAMIVVAHVDYRALAWLRRGDGWRSGTLYVLALLLLAAVLIPGIGTESLGARRALVLIRGGAFSLGFQPSEIAKVVLVIWLSAALTRPGARLSELRRGLLPILCGAGLMIALTGVEDFGTAALMGLMTLILLVLGGARWLHVGLVALAGSLAGAALLLLKDYRLDRITSFLADAPDPMGKGYQINQAMIAIGSGGWLGRGLGAGVQKYGYLPQDTNDFILAIICEELGVVGGIAVALAFVLLLVRGWRLAATAGDPFGRLLAAGLALLVCLQAAFNFGVVTHSIPTKGISLPFVSEGGSGVVFLGMAAGLLASVGWWRNCEFRRAKNE